MPLSTPWITPKIESLDRVSAVDSGPVHFYTFKLGYGVDESLFLLIFFTRAWYGKFRQIHLLEFELYNLTAECWKWLFFVVAWLAEPYVGSTTHFNTSLSLINHRICWVFFTRGWYGKFRRVFPCLFQLYRFVARYKKVCWKTTATSPIWLGNITYLNINRWIYLLNFLQEHDMKNSEKSVH